MFSVVLIEELVAAALPIILGTKKLLDRAWSYAGFFILSNYISIGYSDELLKLVFILG
jgi:hypothetical protein